MSHQRSGMPHDGSLAKSALPNPPSWIVFPNAVVKAAPPPPPPPPPPLDVDQASSTTPPCASLTCTVGQMSTRVDFANIQDFDRYGMQILPQAHLASMCMVAPPAASPVNLQMMQSQFASAASIVPVSNMSLLNAPTSSMDPTVNRMMPETQPASSSALQLASDVRPYVPRPVSISMLSHWPPATETSLPKERWFLLNELWVHLPMNYQYDIAEVPASINCSLMHGCFEVPWQQNPTIFVLLEFPYLRIYDSQGPL